MKRFVLIALAALVLCGTTATAFAKSARSSRSSSPDDVEVDASLVAASAPASGFDSTVGVTFGAGMMLPQIDRNLQGRVELSYFSWSATEFGVDVTYTRVPLAAGGRFFLPTQNDKLKIFLQGMLELSFDKVEVALPSFFGTIKSSESDTRLGLVPGVGIEYKANPNLGIVADARVHIITDSYFTLQVGVAYHF